MHDHKTLPIGPRARGIRRGFAIAVAASCLLAAGGCVDWFLTGGPDDQNGETSTETGVPWPADAIELLANNLYNAVDAGLDVTEQVAAILKLFAPVHATTDPTVSEAQADEFLQELLDSGEPFFFDFHAEAIAAGFAQGMLLTQDSLFASMDGDGGPSFSTGLGVQLTAAAVATRLSELLDHKDIYSGTELMPALLLALSRVRAGRWETGGDGTVTDVWGDDYLDPLQFTLLSSALQLAAAYGSAAQPSQRATVVAAAPESRRVRDLVTGFIGDVLGVPLTLTQAQSSTIAGSVLLYGHEFMMQVEPNAIWKCRAGGQPCASEASVTVIFNFVPAGPMRARILRFANGGDLPPPGPAPGKPVSWSMRTTTPAGRDGSGLHQNGSFVNPDSHTNGNGVATVTYQAKPDPIANPGPDQPFDMTGGAIEARVGDLMAGAWRTVEAVVVTVHSMGDLDGHLTVSWYLQPPGPSPSQSWTPALRPPDLDL